MFLPTEFSQPALNEFYKDWDADLQEIESIQARYKSFFVPGEGSMNPSVMFVSEAPGISETYERRPFRGNVKEAFDEILDYADLGWDEIYVTNLFKYEPNRRPGKKFVPGPYEFQQSARLLGEEIALVNPKAIVYMGKKPCSLLYPGRQMSAVAGKLSKTRRGMYILCTYSPAVKFHKGESDLFGMTKRHVKKLAEVIS